MWYQWIYTTIVSKDQCKSNRHYFFSSVYQSGVSKIIRHLAYNSCLIWSAFSKFLLVFASRRWLARSVIFCGIASTSLNHNLSIYLSNRKICWISHHDRIAANSLGVSKSSHNICDNSDIDTSIVTSWYSDNFHATSFLSLKRAVRAAASHSRVKSWKLR